MCDYKMRFDTKSIQPVLQLYRAMVQKGDAEGIVIFREGNKCDAVPIMLKDSQGNMITNIDDGARAIAKSMAVMFFGSSDDIQIKKIAPNEYEASRDNIV